MFEIIGILFTIGYWAITLFFFVGGIILCISNLSHGNGWRKFLTIIAIILAFFVFQYIYEWGKDIVFCMFLSGMVLMLVANAGSENHTTTQKEKKYGFGDAFLDAYIEEKVIEEAVSNAIRKSKE